MTWPSHLGRRYTQRTRSRQKFLFNKKNQREKTKANDLKWVREFVSLERECQESYPAASNHEELSICTRKERNDDVKVVAAGERGQTLEFRNGATHTQLNIEEEKKKPQKSGATCANRRWFALNAKRNPVPARKTSCVLKENDEIHDG